MGRHANPDIKRAFAEFQDSSTPSKCLKVRCLHCGYIRAKNTTRQIEHLQECKVYLGSSQARSQTVESNEDPGRSTLTGTRPNPNLQVNRRGPHKRTRDGIIIQHHPGSSAHSTPMPLAPGPELQQQPSLTLHLTTRLCRQFRACTENMFLVQAGTGTVDESAFVYWLEQLTHYNRAYIRMIGQLIGKVQLSILPNSQGSLGFRTLDLLISSLNNTRSEIYYIDSTVVKFGFSSSGGSATPATRSLLDLLSSMGSNNSSLLEGLVVLWATTHITRVAWRYASRHLPQTPPGALLSPHVGALHRNLIPNWMSADFSKYVDTCAIIVDEFANSMNSPNGKEEMIKCEDIFRQVCWLIQGFWPSSNPGGLKGIEIMTESQHATYRVPSGIHQQVPSSAGTDRMSDGLQSHHGLTPGASLTPQESASKISHTQSSNAAAVVAAAVAAAGLQTPLQSQSLAQFATHSNIHSHLSPLSSSAQFMPQMMVRPSSLQMSNDRGQESPKSPTNGLHESLSTPNSAPGSVVRMVELSESPRMTTLISQNEMQNDENENQRNHNDGDVHKTSVSMSEHVIESLQDAEGQSHGVLGQTSVNVEPLDSHSAPQESHNLEESQLNADTNRISGSPTRDINPSTESTTMASVASIAAAAAAVAAAASSPQMPSGRNMSLGELR